MNGSRHNIGMVVAACLCLAGQPALSQDDAGSYLAARSAMAESDFDDAARYYTRALARDVANTDLLENGALAYLASGEMDRAITLARRLHDKLPDNQLAGLLLLADAVEQGQFEAARELVDGTLNLPLIADVAGAWVTAGSGNMSDALAKFTRLSQDPGMAEFGLYHQALALAWVGDLETALDILDGGSDTGVTVPQTKRATLLHAEVLAQLDRRSEAVDVLVHYLALDADPQLIDLRHRLEDGSEVGFDVITKASDGVAEVLYGVARALTSDQDNLLPLTYSRIAEHLRPDLADATLLSAGLLERLGQYDLATETYNLISDSDPAYFDAELGRANALGLSGDEEHAVEVLTALVAAYPDIHDGHSLLGDMLRRQERYDEASRAYDRAIELLAGTDAEDWFLYYLRGITHEREDRWPQAEADFRKALELNPNHPSVLNYLGYSFIEMKTNFDEALTMIQTAVDLRPNDGYITDSLGWAYYRLNRFDEAVTVMERAVELMPVDPVINDHLGDTFWAVGRMREAQFQWMRALSFEPEDVDAERIRRKLEVGLDVVLEEEGAPPLHGE